MNNHNIKKTVELSSEKVRDFQRQLRKQRVADGELEIDDWEESTGVYEFQTMSDLIKEKLCSYCRNEYVESNQFSCSTCQENMLQTKIKKKL